MMAINIHAPLCICLSDFTDSSDDPHSCLNILVVKAYGESEFWLSGGKAILVFILFAFTFVSMVGGNPQHDPYGFRYWNNPGAFAEYFPQESSDNLKDSSLPSGTRRLPASDRNTSP